MERNDKSPSERPTGFLRKLPCLLSEYWAKWTNQYLREPGTDGIITKYEIEYAAKEIPYGIIFE